jgi:hypothetical protein
MRTSLLLSFVVFALGCATAPPRPSAILEHNQASLRAAEEVGAQNVPEAKLHLQLAREQTDVARRMAANGDERSELVLARADADAELAIALTRENTMRIAALHAAEDLRAVQARGTP